MNYLIIVTVVSMNLLSDYKWSKDINTRYQQSQDSSDDVYYIHRKDYFSSLQHWFIEILLSTHKINNFDYYDFTFTAQKKTLYWITLSEKITLIDL